VPAAYENLRRRRGRCEGPHSHGENRRAGPAHITGQLDITINRDDQKILETALPPPAKRCPAWSAGPRSANVTDAKYTP